VPAIPQRDLASIFRWQPWNHGDPPPEIWQIIQELDRVHQLRAATAILDAHIAVAQAQVKGLEGLRSVVAEAGKG
jgi:hypothetical protein